MTNLDTRPITPTDTGGVVYLQWGPIIAGTLAAAALASLLHSFAAALGLGLGSAAPTWRDVSFALVLLSALYLVLVALASYGFGGFVAGRLRQRVTGTPEEMAYRDGMHGLMVWALATILTVLLALAAASAATRLAAPGSANTGPGVSVAGENIIAYDLDRLFRSDRRPEGDISAQRAEAARILLTTSSHRGMTQEDRAYLVRMVGTRTGLAGPDAERRVDDVAARAKQNIQRARASSVILAFALGASSLLGAAAAWLAAGAGGRIRDGIDTPSSMWDWGRHAEYR
ncbi:MAG: hypothetical protein ACJ8F3_17745 [Xanthobacteraceae bacterium]